MEKKLSEINHMTTKDILLKSLKLTGDNTKYTYYKQLHGFFNWYESYTHQYKDGEQVKKIYIGYVQHCIQLYGTASLTYTRSYRQFVSLLTELFTSQKNSPGGTKIGLRREKRVLVLDLNG